MYGDDSRNKTPSTTSLTCPARPSGGSQSPSPSKLSAGCIGVWITPGETALTRMPSEAYSTASDRVAAARPPLVSAASTAGARGQPEETGQVDSGGQGVVGRGVLGERLGDGHADVVDQRVDAPEPAEGRVDDPAGGGRVGDIAIDGEQVRFSGRLDRQAAGHHRPAAPAVSRDQAGADALRGSGDDGHPAVGFHGLSPPGAGMMPR